MVDKKKVEELIDISQKIVKQYFSENVIVSAKDLKHRLRDFLTNPFWDDKRVFEMKRTIMQEDFSSRELKILINGIEEKIDELYSNFINNKPHLLPKKMKKYEDGLIEFFKRLGRLKGQSEVFSTILGYLMIHKNLTQEQLKELSNYSRGAISTNLKTLVESGFVKKELIKGTRKYLYSVGSSLADIASKTSIFKIDLNEESFSFTNKKMEELEQYEGEKGQERLKKQLSGFLRYLNLQKNALMTIVQSDYIKQLGEER